MLKFRPVLPRLCRRCQALGTAPNPAAPTPRLFDRGSPEYRRLLYRASYRGMLETELILRSFFAGAWTELQAHPRISEGVLNAFLDEDDPDIFRWINKPEGEIPAAYANDLIGMIRAHLRHK